ncbi:hypothetical protein RM53_11150 [Brevundimonas nasdae]|uniref:Uncharacterized protein n=1 Tax=Brevundimonas nasdae TaxID=172043 RepID=A0A0B4CR98_9CAUL|nr:hypothetical protein [Brevundimonas nasdae]KIC56911.1 hypothetical protein RM53_11150 [Brevundimonas nasdae]
MGKGFEIFGWLVQIDGIWITANAIMDCYSHNSNVANLEAIVRRRLAEERIFILHHTYRPFAAIDNVQTEVGYTVGVDRHRPKDPFVAPDANATHISAKNHVGRRSDRYPAFSDWVGLKSEPDK